MNLIKKLSLLFVLGLAAVLCSCSSSAPSLSGVYSGKNALGFEYKINFISSTDCIVTDPRRGQGPATYRIVSDQVILTMPGGGGANIIKQGDTLTFNDDGYTVVMRKE